MNANTQWILVTLGRFLWMRDRKLFYSSIENIEYLVRMARQEAGWLLVERRQTNNSEALKEIAQNTEIILSTLRVDNDSSPCESNMKPVKHCIVPPRNTYFIGRSQRIEEIHTIAGKCYSGKPLFLAYFSCPTIYNGCGGAIAITSLLQSARLFTSFLPFTISIPPFTQSFGDKNGTRFCIKRYINYIPE